MEIATSDELTFNNYSKLNATRTRTKELDLHLISDLEGLAHKKVGFIPLPDIYPRLPPLPEVPDWFAILNLKNLNKDSFQYFNLDKMAPLPSGLEKRGLDASIYHKTKKPTEGTQ
ncbi:hypothetical protein [Leptospira borgpetersenii]|uniref:hypothetical protein n=1 Tax=Leptospira borgpetersenii TaxID=174 RepID=UPI0027DD9BB5|nr:hypothetical protein [Leptospira borgpetersenii]